MLKKIDEPSCIHGHDHKWVSPHEVVGGRKEYPGVFNVKDTKNGMIMIDVCEHCGKYRSLLLFPGVIFTSYKDADKISNEWLNKEGKK